MLTMHTRGIEHPNNRYIPNKKFQKINSGTSTSDSDVIIAMVTSRDQNWNTFWASIEDFAKRIDDLQLTDDTVATESNDHGQIL
jgi:hypothetical protein